MPDGKFWAMQAPTMATIDEFNQEDEGEETLDASVTSRHTDSNARQATHLVAVPDM